MLIMGRFYPFTQCGWVVAYLIYTNCTFTTWVARYVYKVPTARNCWATCINCWRCLARFVGIIVLNRGPTHTKINHNHSVAATQQSLRHSTALFTYTCSIGFAPPISGDVHYAFVRRFLEIGNWPINREAATTQSHRHKQIFYLNYTIANRIDCQRSGSFVEYFACLGLNSVEPNSEYTFPLSQYKIRCSCAHLVCHSRTLFGSCFASGVRLIMDLQHLLRLLCVKCIYVRRRQARIHDKQFFDWSYRGAFRLFT